MTKMFEMFLRRKRKVFHQSRKPCLPREETLGKAMIHMEMRWILKNLKKKTFMKLLMALVTEVWTKHLVHSLKRPTNCLKNQEEKAKLLSWTAGMISSKSNSRRKCVVTGKFWIPPPITVGNWSENKLLKVHSGRQRPIAGRLLADKLRSQRKRKIYCLGLSMNALLWKKMSLDTSHWKRQMIIFAAVRLVKTINKRKISWSALEICAELSSKRKKKLEDGTFWEPFTLQSISHLKMIRSLKYKRFTLEVLITTSLLKNSSLHLTVDKH